MWNLTIETNEQTKHNKSKLYMNIDSRMMVARRERGWAKWMKGIKRYKLPVVK